MTVNSSHVQQKQTFRRVSALVAGTLVVGTFTVAAQPAHAVSAATVRAAASAPSAPSFSAVFVPKLRFHEVGNLCGATSAWSTSRAEIALTSHSLKRAWNVETSVKFPHKSWSAPKVAAGPNYGWTSGRGEPRHMFDALKAKKGVTKVRARYRSVPPDSLAWDEVAPPDVVGAWGTARSVKITAKKLAQVKTYTVRTGAC